MNFVDAAKALWATVLARGARMSSARELKDIIEAGKAAKPALFDATVSGLGQRYRGDQHDIIEAKLQERYPHSSQMPINPVNWLAFWARSDAGVYVVEAERFLEDGGVAVDPKEARAKAWARALEDLGISTLMPELERRALTGVKSAVVEIGWSKVDNDDEGQPFANIYWPSDVIVLCHPSAPKSDRAIMVCGLRQTPSTAAPDDHTWLIWSRTCTENADGTVATWAPWTTVRISTDGSSPEAPREYPGARLPILFLRLEQSDGSFWPTPERDTLIQVDELNIGRSNQQHTVDLQGHGQGVYGGSFLEADEIPMGPDRWIKVGPGETITAVNFNPEIEAMDASRAQALREVAVSRSNNPDAYATTPTVASSGISRKIANLPHDNRIRELRPIFRRFEELLQLALLQVLDLHAPPSYAPTFGPGVRGRVTFGVPPDYEEMDAKQRRLEADFKMKVISLARYAVLMGHYDTIADAVGAGLSDVIEREVLVADEIEDGPLIATVAAPKQLPAPATPPPNRAMTVDAPPPPPTPPKSTDPDEPAPTGSDVTINELTLGIERMGKLGDLDTVNILRRALAQKLGVKYDGDMTAADLPSPSSPALP